MHSSNQQRNLEDLESLIKVRFHNRSLLETALVHTSYVNEHESEGLSDNERLEFLGDAVLELVTTAFLFENFPSGSEGQLTNFRSALVSGKHLAHVARQLNIGDYLLLSRGEQQSGGRDKNYILANTLEAIIGAVYLDSGFDSAKGFIHRFIIENLDEILKKGLNIDAKSKFQEIAQKKLGITPIYQVISKAGPDHNKTFQVGAYLADELVAAGKGSSKQKAEQDAAYAALNEKGWL